MKILGFNFNKISVEKMSDRPNNLKINSNVDLKDIKDAKADLLKSDEKFLAVTFNFTVDYSPNFAKIELNGTVLFALEPKMANEVLKMWEDDKKNLPDEFKFALFNTIMRKSNIKSLELGEEMNLPPHINLPTVRRDNLSESNNTTETKDKD